MFDINSPGGIAARNIILAGLGADPIEHYNCKCIPTQTRLTVERVIYNDPATVIYWSDKTRTVVKCQPGDTYDPKTGFLLAFCKKVCGNAGNYNNLLREYVPGYGKEDTEDGHE